MESFENRNKVKVYLSKNQGKIHSGWMLPPHASSKILKDMREKVDSEINILRESILRRRRSDSFPSNIDQEGDPVDFRVPGYSWWPRFRDSPAQNLNLVPTLSHTIRRNEPND